MEEQLLSIKVPIEEIQIFFERKLNFIELKQLKNQDQQQQEEEKRKKKFNEQLHKIYQFLLSTYSEGSDEKMKKEEEEKNKTILSFLEIICSEYYKKKFDETDKMFETEQQFVTNRCLLFWELIQVHFKNFLGYANYKKIKNLNFTNFYIDFCNTRIFYFDFLIQEKKNFLASKQEFTEANSVQEKNETEKRLDESFLTRMNREKKDYAGWRVDHLEKNAIILENIKQDEEILKDEKEKKICFNEKHVISRFFLRIETDLKEYTKSKLDFLIENLMEVKKFTMEQLELKSTNKKEFKEICMGKFEEIYRIVKADSQLKFCAKKKVYLSFFISLYFFNENQFKIYLTAKNQNEAVKLYLITDIKSRIIAILNFFFSLTIKEIYIFSSQIGFNKDNLFMNTKLMKIKENEKENENSCLIRYYL